MRKWLQKLVDQYLPVIALLDDTPASRATAQKQADWMKQEWAAQGMATLNQQRNLMTEVRQAIKRQLGAGHFSLESMDFTSEEWTQMNHAIAERVAEQNQQQVILNGGTVNAIVARATNLLLSREWADIAAGLAVLTGRRSTEIVKTAEFEAKSAYSVVFIGALKRRGEEVVLRFEIPTLCQAKCVLSALGRLRKFVPAQALTNEQVNDRFSGPVARACDLHFRDLVPPVAGRDTLYTHLFRKIYATIATYFYCPKQVDEAEYRAEIQGHFAEHSHLSRAARRTIASDRHYRSYLIQDSDGAMRKGIKLAQLNVEVIEVFQPTATIDESIRPETETPTPTPPKRKISSLRVFQQERDRWVKLLDQMGMEGTQPQKMSLLLEWVEGQLVQAELGEELMGPAQPEPVTAEGTEAELVGAGVPTHASLEELPADAPVGAQGTVAESSPAMERAWEKIGDLTQVLTRLAERLDASAQTPIAEPSAPAVPREARTATAVQPEGVKQRQGPPTRATTANAQEKVNQAIDQIIKYNSTPGLPREQMWAVTLSVLKTATKVYQKVIQRVLEQRKAEIEAHHQLHGLGKYHNTVHRKTGAVITDVVKL